MKEFQIQCEGGKEITISRWPDGKYSMRIFSGTGHEVAHLLIKQEEAKKLQGALIVLEAAYP